MPGGTPPWPIASRKPWPRPPRQFEAAAIVRDFRPKKIKKKRKEEIGKKEKKKY
jgi:hypothetical protein